MSIKHVSHTCQLWRRLVFEAHWFWTNLVLVGGQGATFANVRAKLAHYVARTNGHPISLKIGEAPAEVPNIFLDNVFSNVVAPWSSICFIVKCIHNIHTFLHYYHKYPSQIGHLSEVALTLEEEDEDSDFSVDFDFTSLISLRSLTLDIESLDISLLKVNWRSLVSLTLCASASPAEYLDVVCQCHHLENLSITPDPEDEDDPVAGPVLQLEKLRKLVVTSPTSPVTLFRRLSTPVLEELMLNIPTPFEGENDSLNIFLNRMSGYLRVFHCSGGLFLHALSSTRHTLANLETLRLFQEYDDDDCAHIFELFVHATSKSQPTHQFFHLEVLEILDHPPLTAEDARLVVEMSQSRGEAELEHVGYKPDEVPRPLKRVVNTESFEDQDRDFSVMDELLKAHENGLLVHSL
ncbi:hypothetical protein CPB83DRAFT_843653 [Crepidotus variabilis]|uniref:Uncharacterized protein n=1 Tax=Crepidotus variabilis TaxID=179855 RepID=A0A9P6ETM6_9AGAR|nr:hypothetical protein CPB83DRAFT_843653 [Crepidotus variabilis]